MKHSVRMRKPMNVDASPAIRSAWNNVVATCEKLEALTEEQTRYEGLIEGIEQERARLEGNRFAHDGGVLGAYLNLLDGHQIAFAHSKLRKLYMVPPSWVPINNKKVEYVLTRVTPARIYYTVSGTANRESFVNHGGVGSMSSRVDIERTFPEGLAAYCEANNIKVKS